MESLTIGVLITYYGERDLLRECLQTIANQTRPPDEILIYDDASDAPAEQYVPAGLPVKILRGAVNRGPAYGRNQLLQASTSRYIHFHDADDLFHPSWHARVRDVLEGTNVDVVFTEIDVANERSIQSTRVLALDQLAAGADLLRFCIQGVMLVPAGTYRRQTALANAAYRTSLWQAEDFDFHVRLAASRPTYAVITDPLVTIRIRPEGRSRDQAETWSSYIAAIESLSTDLPAQYRSDLADAAARAGSVLYKIGARAQAKHAFKLAARLGPPRFTTQRRVYRLLASAVGFETTEQLARAYRGMFPAWLRAYIAAHGSASPAGR